MTVRSGQTRVLSARNPRSALVLSKDPKAIYMPCSAMQAASGSRLIGSWGDNESAIPLFRGKPSYRKRDICKGPFGRASLAPGPFLNCRRSGGASSRSSRPADRAEKDISGSLEIPPNPPYTPDVSEDTRGPGRVPPDKPRGSPSRPPSNGRPGQALSFIRRRLNLELGLILPRLKRSIWILGETPSSFEKAGAFIQSLAEAVPQYRLVMMTSDPRTLDRLREKFVDDEVLPLPRESGAVSRHYFRRLRPALIVTLTPAGSDPVSILERARSNFVPVVALRPGEPAPDAGGLLSRRP